MNRKGTVEYGANEGRERRESYYRALTRLDESCPITEDDLQDWALKRTSALFGCPVERIKADLLHQIYTGYENYEN